MSELDQHLDEVLVHGRQPVFVQLSEPDPTWPAQYAQHRARIRAALGEVETEHVGSTAVPGLAAKPLIDVQLAVADLDEAGDLLEQAGYALRAREPVHRCLRGHGANVHLHLAGDPHLEQRLRLRDRLRTDPVARQRYEDLKRSLAGREWPDMNYYAEAKGPLIRELLG